MEVQMTLFFNDIVPEIEILCDDIEEFLMNKYFKQKSLGKKLYFKEEKLQEMTFYLSKNKKEEKVMEEMASTADSEAFGGLKLNKLHSFL